MAPSAPPAIKRSTDDPSARTRFGGGTATLVVLLLMAAAWVPGAAGQAVLEDEVGQVTQGEGSLAFTDPSGDVGPYGIHPDPLPEHPLYDYLDIREVVLMDQDADTISARIRTGGFEDLDVATRAASVQDFRCWLNFGTGDEDYWDYQASWRAADLLGGLDGSVGPMSNSLLRFYSDEDDWDWEWFDGVMEVTYDATLPGFDVKIPKQLVLAGKDWEPLQRGDVITTVRASCYADIALYGSVGDRASAGDATLDIVDPGSGSLVQVAIPAPVASDEGREFEIAGAPVGLAADVATKVPVHLTNHDSRKRIVTLTAQAYDADGTVLPWNLTIAPTIELRAEETRVAQLIVRPPPGLVPLSEGQVEVSIEVVGMDTPGRAARAFIASPPFDIDNSRLYLHSRSSGSQIDNDEVDHWLMGQEYGFTSLAQDPRWEDWDPTVRFGRGFGDFFELDPLTKPVQIDPDGTYGWTMELRSTFDGLYRVELGLGTPLGTLFHMEEQWTGSGVHTFERGVFEDEALLLPAGTVISGYVWIENWDWAGLADPDVDLIIKNTFLDVPLMPPRTESIALTDGRFLPTLTLAAGHEPEEYVNPEAPFVWELVLANEGVEADDLTVTVDLGNASAAGWTAQVLPGATYRVTPGNATPVGIQVVAPAHAAEGEVVPIEVRVTSTEDRGAAATVELRAIVTHEIAIESRAYDVARADQIQPVAEVEESPLPWLGPAISVMLALAVAVRGRRPHRFDAGA